MLIAQAPLRVSLLGGGSDLPAYLVNNDGAVLSFAIDRRVFIVGHPFTHRTGIALKYSKFEDVQTPTQLAHPIAREVLTRYQVTDIDIAVMSDVPAGTGLGSSSSFTVAFLAFVRSLCGIESTSVDLAREACDIEIEMLREPIGYQDQWASALGGINTLHFAHGEVEVESLVLSHMQISTLENNLRLIPVGKPRSASALLSRQAQSISLGSHVEKQTGALVELVKAGKEALQGEVDQLGPLLDTAWAIKRSMTDGITSIEIDQMYQRGLSSGSTGGKLLGAGGSGYLAFYVPQSAHQAFDQAFPTRLDFKISQNGAGVIHES